MTFILISGDPDTGKTHVCKRLYGLLKQDPSFTEIYYPKFPMRKEILAHYEKNGKHIVLNSAADDKKCMERLARYIDGLAANNVRPDIIVTAIHETGKQKDRMLALLEEAAKGTGNLVQYYKQNIANVTTFALKSLGSHAFVLRLERQSVSGTEEEREKALAPYWNGKANKAKKTLDLAVARL